MSTEYEWNGLRVRRDENGEWEYLMPKPSITHASASNVYRAIAAELNKLYPLPIEPPEPGTIEPPEPGTIVHKVGRSASWTDEMTFMCVDPDDPDYWIVRDGEGDLDRYWYWQLALGSRPESDDR